MRIWIVLYTVLMACCYGDWNTDFDQKTHSLLTHLIEPKTKAYKKEYRNFQEIRDKILLDVFLKRTLSAAKATDKDIIVRPEDGVLLKKRMNNNIREAYVWEISTLLGSRSCIVPSFPIYMGGKLIVLQQQEPFFIREKGSYLPSKSVLKKVSTEAYWEGHLQAYLFGIGDLVGRNVGVNAEGRIRFFDAEGSFTYQDFPEYPKKLEADAFCTGFYAHSLAWPHFEDVLTQKEVDSLQQLINSWSSLEQNIEIYLTFRNAPINIKGLMYRLEKIRSFPLEKGKSFKDFYAHLFPRIGQGMGELQQIVTQLTQSKVSIGEAIVWSRKGVRSLDVKDKKAEKMRQWIASYIEGEEAR